MDAGGYDPSPLVSTPVTPYTLYDGIVGGVLDSAGWRYLPGANKFNGQSCTAPSPADSQVTADCNSEGRHFNGINITFLDGHVKWLEISKVVAQAKTYTNNHSQVSDWDPVSP